jgi:hypothetical protein
MQVASYRKKWIPRKSHADRWEEFRYEYELSYRIEKTRKDERLVGRIARTGISFPEVVQVRFQEQRPIVFVIMSRVHQYDVSQFRMFHGQTACQSRPIAGCFGHGSSQRVPLLPVGFFSW